MPGLPRCSTSAVSSPCYLSARNRSVRDRRRAFTGHIIDHVHDPETPAVSKLVVYKVQRPTSIGNSFDEDRRPRPDCPAPGPAFAHGQTLFAIEAVYPVDARGLAFLAQQDEQAPVAEALPLAGEVAKLFSQRQVGRPARAIPDHFAVRVDD
jgi:hypothetical protein